MNIAVTGCRKTLPLEFPLKLRENAGNMIHANAPFEMFPGAVDYADGDWRASGARSFAEYVDEHCSHLIVTMANSFRSGEQDGTRYSRFISMLEQYNKPIVVFGLGIQAPTTDLDRVELHPEAIRMMQVLGERCVVVGGRGATTAEAFLRFAGVENTFVTGCPSLYSRPEAIEQLARNPHPAGKERRIAYSPTKLNKDDELALLYRNIQAGSYLIEAGNPKHERFYDWATGPRDEPQRVPRHLRPLVRSEGGPTRAKLAQFFEDRYRMFRNPYDWYDFNSRNVSFTYGTRFHVNMASLLSGVPAMWLTHDARTEELTDFPHVPSMSVEAAVDLSPEDIRGRVDYTAFFSEVPALFDRFNEYLALNGLPQIAAPRL
ncbi:MAG: polysaccharide pyruvyl transferase family protein [Actinomycetota bacterium]|nr:polysaccharide pyruvyl transferase family protein [Actinomycetota bacterium]